MSDFGLADSNLPRGLLSAYIGLGSNQGDRLVQLSEAVYHLDGALDLEVVAVSSAYESVPSGMPPGTRDFLNAVIKISTRMQPGDLLATCLGLETLMGRNRSWVVSDRPIDLDILHVEDVVLRTPDLILPHQRAHVRTFVLMPWIEIEPGLRLHGATIEEWLEMLPPEDRIPCEYFGEIPPYQML